jgi:hypothetical protein
MSRIVAPFAALARRPAILFLLAVGLAVGACAPLIAQYNAEAYKNATSLKAETLSLIDKAGEAYPTRKKDVEILTTKIDAAYEYVAGLPDNQISAQQWQILRDSNGVLYGAFVRVWQQQGTVSRGFRTQYKLQMAEAFDQIICLEANKQAATSCANIAAARAGSNSIAAGGAR